MRDKLTSLLTDADRDGGQVFAALFELDDRELIPLLQALGKRAHVLLGNGSARHKGDDENADARDALRMCDVHDRMTAPRALAHNKFLVICDSHQTPQSVWTGSTNWTMTGLCTQANNAVLVENTALAHDYLEQWKTLVECEDASPAGLMTSDATPRTARGLDGVTIWFTPMHGLLDLEQAGELIRGAKSGILFLMFNPGPRGTLFNDISDLALPAGQHYDPDLYIQGVLNQNPGTAKNPVTLFNRGEKIDANEDVVLPAAIPGPLEYWRKELLKLPRTFAMVHSKVIVVDPYGDNPVVMTGSHNMGPKASGVNDENLLIIEGDSELASQYAGNIMQIYSQYRWRHRCGRSMASPPGRGSPTTTSGRSARRGRTRGTTGGGFANSISGLANPPADWRIRMPKCTKLMLIRHAEKPDGQANIGGVSEAGAADRNDLTAKGWRRAGALVRLFNPAPPGGLRPGLAVPGAIFAAPATDDDPSKRPLHTAAPLAADLGLTVQTNSRSARRRL